MFFTVPVAGISFYDFAFVYHPREYFQKKKRRSSHRGGSGDRPVSWASSEGMSSSPR